MLSSPLCNTVLKVIANAIGQEKEMKAYKLRKKNETVPLHFFTADVIVYVQNPKEYFKIIESTGKFSKVTGYEINI